MQIIITTSLIFGIIIGESIAIRTFGISNKWYANLIDVMLFVVLLICLLNFIYLKEINYFLIIGLNFFLGLCTILLTKGLTTGFGFLSKKIIEKVNAPEITDDVLIAGLLRNLKNKGLKNAEIMNILVNSGFNKRKVEYYMNKTIYKEL